VKDYVANHQQLIHGSSSGLPHNFPSVNYCGQRVNPQSSLTSTMFESEVTCCCENGACCTDDDCGDICDTKKRGFSHVFKSKKGNSSLRVQAASKVMDLADTEVSTNGEKRRESKARKLHGLMQVKPSKSVSISLDSFSGRPIFFSGTRRRTIRNCPPNAKILSVVEDLNLIDTTDGARMVLPNGDMVFTLVPRHQSIGVLTNASRTVTSLDALHDATARGEKMGKKRIPVAEENDKYFTVGLKPNRNSKGIDESWPKDVAEEDREEMVHLMTRCEHLGKGYLPSDDLRALDEAALLGGWKQIKGKKPLRLWRSLSCGKNHYLNLHTDEDFFYCMATIASRHGWKCDVDRYAIDAEVCCYFVFAKQGVAVALRPGDTLLFNPMYEHCLSSRTVAYMQKDIFTLSLYLKTAIVGKHDNSLPLTEEEQYLLS
jgi:hypothetical protein